MTTAVALTPRDVNAPDLESSRAHYYGRYFGDPVSRLFWAGDKLQLGFLPGYAQRFSALLDERQLEDLFADRLLCRASDTQTRPGFERVFDLDCSARITYWHEWPPQMLRAAALRFVELLRRLAERGLTLRNPHPWNLLYDGREFVYINPGSVVPFDEETFASGYEKIARFFVRPLLLIENGFAHLARRLASDARDGVIPQDISHLDGKWTEWPAESSTEAIAPFLAAIASKLESFECKMGGQHWLNYFHNDCDFSADTSWTRKQQALESILHDTSIKSVLDLGANTGHYARIAARHGREVIAADFDPAVVDRSFVESRNADVAIYPVVLDFSHPTQGQGIEGRWLPPATERLAADLVLCFALSHHMVFGRYRLDFEQVAIGIRSFARKWALVEYIERNYKIIPANFRPEADGWYDVDHFAAALRRHFPVVECLQPAKDGRRLLVCGPERSGL